MRPQTRGTALGEEIARRIQQECGPANDRRAAEAGLRAAIARLASEQAPELLEPAGDDARMEAFGAQLAARLIQHVRSEYGASAPEVLIGAREVLSARLAAVANPVDPFDQT